MITKKLDDTLFAWEPRAFNGKGYWFTLSNEGKLGKAATREQFHSLGRPRDETKVEKTETTKEEISKVQEYKQNDKIRKKGLFDSIADRIIGGQKIGESIKGGISDKLKAGVTGLKEKFDPLNIASALMGRSKLGTAIVGKIFGRKKEDIEHFIGKGKTSSKDLKDPSSLQTDAGDTKIGALKSHETLPDIVNKLFDLIKKDREEKQEYYDNLNNHNRELQDKRDQKNRELIEALTGETKGKLRVKKPEKVAKLKEKTKTEVGAPGQTGTKTSGATTPGAPSATGTPTGKGGIVTSIKEAATSTLGKIAIGGAVGVAAVSSIGKAIAGAESGDSYEITFGDRVDSKTGNVIRGKNISPEQMFGRNLTDLTLNEVNILGKERNKRQKNTSAMGKYQFMNTTLFGSSKGPGLVQKMGLDMNTKFTPEVQDKLFNMLHEQDVKQLRKLGVPITPGYEYMAHYVGAGGAAAVYNARNTNLTVAQAIVAAGYPDPSPSNKELTQIKAANFESELEKRLLKKGGYNIHASRESNSPPSYVEAKQGPTDDKQIQDWAYSVHTGQAKQSDVPQIYQSRVETILQNPPKNWGDRIVKTAEPVKKIETKINEPATKTMETASQSEKKQSLTPVENKPTETIKETTKTQAEQMQSVRDASGTKKEPLTAEEKKLVEIGQKNNPSSEKIQKIEQDKTGSSVYENASATGQKTAGLTEKELVVGDKLTADSTVNREMKKELEQTSPSGSTVVNNTNIIVQPEDPPSVLVYQGSDSSNFLGNVTRR